MAKTKKIATSVAAVATAAALLLGGTFAWQSVNQTALNEASDVINPGGRLHDDFNGSNKDVYVENFTDPDNGGEDIFARIRLEEYFEITMNKDTPVETVDVVVGERVAQTDEDGNEITDENGKTVYDKNGKVFTAYETLEEGVVKAAVDDDGTAYWSWTTGGETVYMPTFNLNKDSLQADINGTYAGPDGDENTDEDKYQDYYEYTDGEDKTVDATYDADANNIEDDGTTAVEETHYATTTANAKLMSMAEWQALSDDEKVDDYWVYDEDGWVYYAKPIPAGTATGLLLDGIELNQVMDDSWYYAINVVAQFVTADDLGKTDGTGFYDTEKGTAPSAEALALLAAIGVETEGVLMVNDAAALQDALSNGEDVTIGGVIEATEANEREDLSKTYNILWTEGGTVSGGELTLGNAYFGLFVNNENGWPVDDDGANAATMSGTSIYASATNAAVYTQAIDAPIELNNVTINAGSVGVWAEYDGETVTLNNCNITSRGGNEDKPWLDSAVAVASNGNIVINSGTYTGDYAVYVYSSGGTIEINGGYFDGALTVDAGTLTIYGGTFTADPSAYAAEGYKTVDNGDGTWTVQEA